MVDSVISAKQLSSGNTTNLTNTSLLTDFNVLPYYDDYDPNKQFYRILFKPGYAVQARELTQIQSMLQSQISRFGKHVFKEGSIVLPGSFTLKVAVNGSNSGAMDYVKLKTLNASNTTIDVKSFLGQTIVGSTSNISAYVVDVATASGNNAPTLYVNYISASSSNVGQTKFAPNETLNSANAGTCIVKNDDPVANTGYASWFQIEEGVYFAKEHFIHFPTQSVILDRYNANPSCKVGFFVSEDIITAAEDTSLLDPALESSNYSAPGADRFRLLSTLSVVDLDSTVGSPDFVTLLTIKNGVIQQTNEKSNYNILGDRMADRTNDESGDYVVSGLNVQLSEHNRTTVPVENYGRYANGNNSLLVVSVDTGLAYVKGYAVSNGDKIDLSIPKPVAFNNVNQQITSTAMGQYLRVTEAVGSWQVDRDARINFFDQVNRRITNGGVTTGQKWSTGAQSGNNIGSAIVNSIQYFSGTPGYDAVYDLYLTDIRMNGTNSFTNVRSVYFDNTPHSDVGADVLGANNTTSNTSLRELNRSPLLYYVGTNFTRSVRDVDNSSKTQYFYSKSDGIASTLSFASGGTVTFVPSLPTNDILPYGTSTLGATDILNDIFITINDTFNVSLTGTCSGSGTTITGTGTNFTRLNIGDKVEFSGQSNTYYVTAIANDLSMTVSNTVTSISGNSIFKAYKTGDALNMTGKGAGAGAQRTISATPTQLVINLQETLGASRNFTITYKVASTLSEEKKKTLKPNRYVTINCATSPGGTTGPYSLGFADVYRIRNIIRKTGSAPANIGDGQDVTSYFRLDNGQRDTQYDIAQIFKNASFSLGATDFLLVHFDYFEPTTAGKAGFYTINSYPIEDNSANSTNSTIRTENVPIYVSPTSQLSFDLRNHIDFRPVKSNTAIDATSPAGSSTNPANTSNTYVYSSTVGMKFPIPSSEMTYNYSSYLGRKDIVTVSKTGTFSVTLGIPSANPLPPDSLDSQMMLATLDIPPYPSLSPAYGNIINRKDLAGFTKKVSNRRYTMRDIGVLDARIKNLEYYTALTLLEKNALNLKIVDSSGLDRFKNGIFVDTFKDTSLSASGIDPDYRIVNDPIELSIRPLFSTDSVAYESIATSGVVVNDGLAFLNYDNVTYLSQLDVTDSRNIERGNYLFRGSLSLTPSEDIWVDTAQLPDEIISFTSRSGLLEISSSSASNDRPVQIGRSILNTTWGNWQRQITGYNLYRGEGAAKQFVGNFNSESAAATAASQWLNRETGQGATIETVYNNSRIGTNYFTNASTDEAAGSNKLISSEVITYIRPQTIYVIGRNLKPYSRLSAFFDNVNIQEYCTPLTLDQYTALTSGRTDIISGFSFAAQGSNLIVDNSGFVYFSFRVPQGRFRTGARTLTVIDGAQLAPASLSSEQDASTGATGKFFANGTKQTTQKTIYSTRGFSTTSEDTYERTRSTESIVLPNTYTPPPPFQPGIGDPFGGGGVGSEGGNAGHNDSCVAYSVFVKVPNDEEGIFCTGFDVFIQRKSQTRGIWCEIREMNSASGITNVSIPGSAKRLTNAQVVESPNGITNPTQIRFDAPVFLRNDTEYAFVVHSDNPPGAKIDPDTSIWIARLGETDINTGKQYNDRTVKGRFYSTSNDRMWDAILDVDMPIVVYRANFNTSSGTITLGNKGIEKLILKNVNSSLSTRIGDVFSTGDRLTLTGANGTPIITHRLLGNTSLGNANGNIIAINGGPEYVMSNTRYVRGEKVDLYHNSNGIYSGITATISALANSTAQLSYYNSSDINVYSQMINSTGGFTVGNIIRSLGNSGFNNRAEVDFVGNFGYSAVSFEPKVLDFEKTGLSYEMRTTSNATTTLGSFESIIPSDTTYFTENKTLLSRTNEILNLSSNKSNQVRVTMSSISSYVSPVFDIRNSHTICIDNIINNDITGENGASGGKAINKYISQTIALADGQDAEDLRVYLTSYRPPGSDVKVYAKFDNINDPDTLAQKLWIPLDKENDGDSLYSSLSDRLDFKEYSYKIPSSYMIASDGSFQYTSNGVIYRGFKYFAIKIVLTSTNSAAVPRVADLRTLALQL